VPKQFAEEIVLEATRGETVGGKHNVAAVLAHRTSSIYESLELHGRQRKACRDAPHQYLQWSATAFGGMQK